MTQKNYHIGVLQDLKSAIRTAWGSDSEIEKTEICNALNAAIKALEQYPILNKIRAEIIEYEGDCRLSVDEYPSCKQCTDNVFETIYGILDKYKEKTDEEKR